MSGFSSGDDLLAGDILLYSTKSAMGRMIRLLDGSEVSHAALFLGDEVAEALTREGLVQRPISESIDDESEWVAVMRVRPAPGEMAPVLDVAQKYLAQDNRYAFGQILLLTGICLTRKLDSGNPLVRRIARTVLNRSAALLERCREEGKEPMICSEFVFRTYDEALPERVDPYSIEILSQKTEERRRWFSGFRRRRRLVGDEAQPTIPSVHPDSLFAQLQAAGDTPEALAATVDKMVAGRPEPEEDLDLLIEQYLAEADGLKAAVPQEVAAGPEVSMKDLLDSARRLTAGLAEATVRKAETENKLYGVCGDPAEAAPKTLADIVADFVTPGDLLRSPSLERVGTIRP